ncbi:Peptidyl-prolyl cis-trans isomerase A precursor [Pirellulimonas nuda]|uniref:peptidylprolyl isomerase n=1 Tax=Pirellulimonas nuda TaxID=2528009 RepID=A0A518D9E3_9BACT|nr:peptidylprolyl isomerase [Pirellulimonas nuda]QDU88112.1 Peptidyl-prolyl cis-trans isomerase A precursor [Pirellulimonas nuda]
MAFFSTGWRLSAIFALTLAAQAGVGRASTIVQFRSEFGNVNVRLYDTATPQSVANFLSYVNPGSYKDVLIHRTMPGFVMQGGRWRFNGTEQVEPQNYPQITQLPPVQNEPGISNIRGTIAFAKLGGDPNSGTREWFFNLADNSGGSPMLDTQNGGFTVFGRVLGNGMSVIDTMAAVPTFGFSGAWDNGPMRNYTAEDYNAFVPVDGDNVVRFTSIVVFPVNPGDFNLDGFVSLQDLALWKADFGSTTKAEADANGDGIVNAADYTIWRDRYVGAGGSIGAIGVPEPATLGTMLLALGAGLAVCRGRRAG